MRHAFEAAKRFDTEPVASREEDARIRDIYLADAEGYSKSIFALREAPVEPETSRISFKRFRAALEKEGFTPEQVTKINGALVGSMLGRMVNAD
jgi:hypothetical protein